MDFLWLDTIGSSTFRACVNTKRRVIVPELITNRLEVSGMLLPQFAIGQRILEMQLRVMTKEDVPAGLRLKELSGWNQTAGDWNRFLKASPGGCFVAEEDGLVCGTATTISYENRFAWIGMVLVDPAYRKRGIGTQLLKKTIEYLDRQKIPTMKLDATPQGRPLYEKLGFVDEYEIERWILKRSPHADTRKTKLSLGALTGAQLELVFAMDQEVFAADRSLLLRSLHDETPQFAIADWRDNVPQGYAFGRRGSFADHLGPWMANNKESAEKLLDEFLARSSRETIVVDCLKSNVVVGELLRSHGFAFSRNLTRMYRGPNAHAGNPASLCAIVGPEFG
jgi:GNAT superfamily N-acetyltransferase